MCGSGGSSLTLSCKGNVHTGMRLPSGTHSSHGMSMTVCTCSSDGTEHTGMVSQRGVTGALQINRTLLNLLWLEIGLN